MNPATPSDGPRELGRRREETPDAPWIGFRARWLPIRPLIVFVLLPLLALLGAVALLLPGPTLSYLFRDTSMSAGVPFYFGAFSTLGNLIWAATSGICLFSAALTRRDDQRRDCTGMLVLGGLISILLMLDDTYLIHEEIFPRYLHLPEIVALGIHAGLMASFLFCFWKRILASRCLLLLLGALGGFGFSLAVDQFLPNGRGQTILLEDGAKLVGIVNWALFFLLASWDALTRPGPRKA